MKKPTRKQLLTIEAIELTTKKKFNGKSRQDAFFFIRDNIEESKRIAQEMNDSNVREITQEDKQKHNRQMAHVELLNNGNHQTLYDTDGDFEIEDEYFGLIDKEWLE